MAAAAVGLGVQLAGGLLGSYAAAEQGNAAYRAEQMNAQFAERNAVLARQQAAEEERRSRIQSSKVIGEARAGYGASGIVSSQGSALDVLQESASNAELDALNIRHSGELRAYEFGMEARLARMRGDAARNSGRIGAAAGILGTVGRGLSLGLGG